MTVMRFSTAPNGTFSQIDAPWAIFGEGQGEPDGLEASAFSGPRLTEVAGTVGTPMFETESLFGAHMAGLKLRLREGNPAVVCVHSLFSEPRRPVVARIRSDNAHRRIFHFDETPGGPGSPEERQFGLTPWFTRLLTPGGRGPHRPARGLVVGFCYPSYGGSAEPFGPTLATRLMDRIGLAPLHRDLPSSFAKAYGDAEYAGFALAAVLHQLLARLDHAGLTKQKLDLLCHGLGARVALSALSLLAQSYPGIPTLQRIDRVVMLGGLAYSGQAAVTLANILFADPPVRPSFYNVLSPEDALLRWVDRRRRPDRALEDAAHDLSIVEDDGLCAQLVGVIGRQGKPDHTLYECFGPDYSEWIDLDFEDPRLARALGNDIAERGFARHPLRMAAHNACFTDPARWQLYRRILCHRKGWAVAPLAARLARQSSTQAETNDVAVPA